MGRYLVLFVKFYFILAVFITFMLNASIMSLVSPFLAAYLTGLSFIKETHQLPTKAQSKKLRHRVTVI